MTNPIEHQAQKIVGVVPELWPIIAHLEPQQTPSLRL